MTLYLIYGDAVDGTLSSESATYATARSGGTISVGDTAALAAVFGHTGPGLVPGSPTPAITWTPALTAAGNYHCFEAFISFDTSVISATAAVVQGANLSLNIGPDNTTSHPGMRVHSYDWGTSVTTADWVNATTAAALPLRASWSASMTSNITYVMNFDTAGVVAGGSTRLLVTHPEVDAGTPVPTTYARYTNIKTGDHATNKPLLRVMAVPLSTQSNVQHASVQMPGPVKAGEPAVVSIRSNGAASPTLTLGYTTLNSTTFTSIATLSAAEFDITAGQSAQNIALTVAPNGDLFVVGSRVGVAFGIAIKAFVRATTTTWTAKASVYQVVSGATGTIDWTMFACAYISGAGTECVFVMAASTATDTHAAYATMNVASARAGAGAAFINAEQHPTWWHAASIYYQFHPLVMSVASAPASAVVFVVSPVYQVYLDVWNGVVTSERVRVGSSSESPKVQAIAIDYDKYLYVRHNWAGIEMRYSSRAADISNVTQGSSIFQGGNALDQWAATYDARAALLRVYVISPAVRTVSRYDYNPVTNTWSAATVISSTIGSVGSVVQTLRTVENVLDERVVMIEAAVTTAGVLSTVVLLDTVGNIAPNAPILGTRNPFIFSNPATFTWTYSDPNPLDVQYKYDLQIQRVSDSVDVVNVVGTVSTVGSHTVAGSTLANNTSYRWRVRTYDQINTVGAWSPYGTFETSDAPIVVITTPATDNIPTDEDSATITWSFTSASGSPQAQRRIRLLRHSDSAVISDTTMQATTSLTGTVTGMLSDVEYRIEVTAISAAGINSNIATRRITPSYSSALAPTLIVTAEPGAEYLTLTVSNPESGDRPLVTSNEVWKREAGTTTYRRVATGVENDGTYRDYAVAQGQGYDYFVRAVF